MFEAQALDCSGGSPEGLRVRPLEVVGIFKYVVETDRRFYLCTQVDVKARTESGDVFFEVTMTDAWAGDMYRPAASPRTSRC